METENTFVITPTCMDPLSVQHTWALLLMPLQLLYSPQTFSFFSLLSLVYAALFFLSSSLFFCFLFFTFSALRCIVLSFFFFFFSSSLLSLVYAALFFFFLPFCLSHLRPIKKKKSMIGATNWLLWVCEFSGCFKDANEFCGFELQAQNRSGCCGYWGLKEKKKKKEKKKRNAWVKVSGFGRKWCEVGRLTGMLDMLLRYGSHKK